MSVGNVTIDDFDSYLDKIKSTPKKEYVSAREYVAQQSSAGDKTESSKDDLSENDKSASGAIPFDDEPAADKGENKSDEPSSGGESGSEKEDTSSGTNASQLEFTSHAFMMGIDLIGAILLSRLDKEDPAHHKLAEYEFNEGKNAIYTYMMESGQTIKVSPMEAMLMVFVVIYAPKAYDAYRNKKAKDSQPNNPVKPSSPFFNEKPPEAPKTDRTEPVEYYKAPKDSDVAIPVEKPEPFTTPIKPPETSVKPSEAAIYNVNRPEPPSEPLPFTWADKGNENPIPEYENQSRAAKGYPKCLMCGINHVKGKHPQGVKKGQWKATCGTSCAGVAARKNLDKKGIKTKANNE